MVGYPQRTGQQESELDAVEHRLALGRQAIGGAPGETNKKNQEYFIATFSDQQTKTALVGPHATPLTTASASPVLQQVPGGFLRATLRVVFTPEGNIA